MIIIFVIAGLCLLIAGGYDLLTTEVPDELPYTMIFAGIVYWFLNGMITGDFITLGFSLLAGCLLLTAGLFLSNIKQWGEADAWILAGIGFTIPLMIVDYLFNFLIVASIFTIIYSIILGFMNRGVYPVFIKNLKKGMKFVILVPALFGIPVCMAALILGANPMPAVIITALVFMFSIFFIYGKTMEEHVLKKTISTKELKKGDVLSHMQWVGLKDDEIKEIMSEKETVVIKEGIRFVPAFFLTFIVTVFYGNIFVMMMGV